MISIIQLLVNTIQKRRTTSKEGHKTMLFGYNLCIKKPWRLLLRSQNVKVFYDLWILILFECSINLNYCNLYPNEIVLKKAWKENRAESSPANASVEYMDFYAHSIAFYHFLRVSYSERQNVPTWTIWFSVQKRMERPLAQATKRWPAIISQYSFSIFIYSLTSQLKIIFCSLQFRCPHHLPWRSYSEPTAFTINAR